MLLDITDLDDGFELDCDVAVVGGGAAGITLARELAGGALGVVVIESGGLEPEPATQELGRGRSRGEPYPRLPAGGTRCLGGTTARWSGELGELDAVDFEARPWLPGSGWPIGPAELEPYRKRAYATCGLTPTGGDGPGALRSGRLRLAHRRRRSDEPLRFGPAYREELAAAANVRVVLHANATGILAGDGAVSGLAIRGLGGRHGTVRARRYVLACGGVENARLLLAAPPSVAGEGADWIGRCFMDHPVHRPLRLLARPDAIAALVTRRAGPTTWLADLAPTRELQERERIGNFGVELHEVPLEPEGDDRRRLEAVWRLHEEIEGHAPSTPALYELEVMQEQAPNRACRLTLGAARDALGVPRVALDYRTSEIDERTARVAAATVAAELGRLGLGRVGVLPGYSPHGAGWAWSRRVARHQLGTTRMADSPARGAVDRDGRPFGVANLHVAGGSLFPTCGYVNPTLTLVALALRLADRLRSAA